MHGCCLLSLRRTHPFHAIVFSPFKSSMSHHVPSPTCESPSLNILVSAASRRDRVSSMFLAATAIFIDFRRPCESHVNSFCFDHLFACMQATAHLLVPSFSPPPLLFVITAPPLTIFINADRSGPVRFVLMCKLDFGLRVICLDFNVAAHGATTTACRQHDSYDH